MINHFKHGSHYCLVFPIASGSDLYSNIKRRQRKCEILLSMDEIKEVGRKIVDALSYLHEQGIVHCDLKPENVLINERGSPTVGDLGSAIFLKDMSKY